MKLRKTFKGSTSLYGRNVIAARMQSAPRRDLRNAADAIPETQGSQKSAEVSRLDSGRRMGLRNS
jgi:hypothetical protein